MRKLAAALAALLLITASAAATDGQVKYIPATFSQVAEAVKHSVVNISTVKIIRQSVSPYFSDEFLERYYGIPRGTFRKQSLGSGFIVSADGYIMTNNHVIDSADEITVKLYNGKEYPAKLAGTDPETDLAVIKINAGSLQPVPFGDPAAINVGDWVVAIGSPFGLEQTVTQGIISAKGRIIGAGPYDDFLQTDAAINPGNSGGPLVNLAGELVGVNTAINSMSGGSEGVGFATPSNIAKKVLDDILKNGRVKRGWLGIGLQDVTPELAAHFKISEGVLVTQIFSGTPAEKSELKRGDVITSYNGEAVKNTRALQGLIGNSPIGKEAIIKVSREGREKEIKVKVGARDAGSVNAAIASRGGQGIGITAGEVTDEIAVSYGMSRKTGVIVLGVEEDSPAEQAGIMRGDVLHELNGREIRSMADYDRAIQALSGKGGDVVLLVERRDAMIYIAFKNR